MFILRVVSYSRGNGSDILYGVLTQQEINESKVHSKQTTTIKQTSFHFSNMYWWTTALIRETKPIYFCNFLRLYIFKMKQTLLMQKSQCKRLTMFFFHFKNCSKIYYASTMHYAWVNLKLMNCIQTTNWNKQADRTNRPAKEAG